MEEEGESSEDIANCLEVVFRAVSKSSLSTVEQMMWMRNIEQQDEYELCYKSDVFWEQTFTPADWSLFADTLAKHIDNPLNNKNNYLESYQREGDVERVAQALEKAGRVVEIIPFYQQQIAYGCNNYVQLVDSLKKAGQIDEAIRWIKKGFEATQKEESGIANQLYDTFKSIQETDENWAQVAALEADSFFNSPSLENYLNLEKASHRIKVFTVMRENVLHFLETGKTAFKQHKQWPLPEPILKRAREYSLSFPLSNVLIDIAIYEKRNDEVVRLYEREKGDGKFSYFRDDSDKIANAIAETHTDIAIQIWKDKAENYIDFVNKSAYQQAAPYLVKVRDALKKSERESEWQIYKQNLHQRNARRPRFIEILNKL